MVASLLLMQQTRKQTKHSSIEALKILLEGMQKSIEKFCEKHYTENDSDTN